MSRYRRAGYGNITGDHFKNLLQATFIHPDTVNQPSATPPVQLPSPNTHLEWEPQTTFTYVDEELVETTGVDVNTPNLINLTEMDPASIVGRLTDYATRLLGGGGWSAERIQQQQRSWPLKGEFLRSLAHDTDFLLLVSHFLNSVEAGAIGLPVDNYLHERTYYTFIELTEFYPPQSMTSEELVILLPPLQFRYPVINGTQNAEDGFDSEAQKVVVSAELVLQMHRDFRTAVDA